MGDDLGTPTAVAAIHNLVRDGYKLFAVGASERLRAPARGRTGDALGAGLDPLAEHWDPACLHGRSGCPRRQARTADVWNGAEPVGRTSVQGPQKGLGAGELLRPWIRSATSPFNRYP